MNKKYYISTAIAYTSGKPHIGNTYEAVLADAIARYKRMKGYDVYFQTGTDEHGEKIEAKAREAGMSPQSFVDMVSNQVKYIWNVMNVSYDRFVRTSDPHHEEVVQKIFDKLYEQGDIYKGKYEGHYCSFCESFFTDSQLISNKCPDCGREVGNASEEAYFFRMSKYQDRLIQYIQDNPSFIQPASRRNEMINNFLKPGLQDLCVSRSSFSWGVPVSFDSKHVIYVWIDALANYITSIGYNVNSIDDEFYKWWPCDLHLVGKDIIRFHTIYWPIILMALDLPLPKCIFGHPWLLFGDDKMSKSKGNIMYADDLVNLFGVDAVRYYVLHEIPFGNDGSITYDLIIDRINGDLANVLGNLVNRTIAMANKYFSSSVKFTGVSSLVDSSFIDLINNTKIEVDEYMEKLEVGNAIDSIFNLLRRSNKYIDETTPWVLAKEESSFDRLQQVIYNLLESIRVAAILLKPFMPDTSDRIKEQLNNNRLDDIYLSDNVYCVSDAMALFQRIDKEKMLQRIKEEKEKK